MGAATGTRWTGAGRIDGLGLETNLLRTCGRRGMCLDPSRAKDGRGFWPAVCWQAAGRLKAKVGSGCSFLQELLPK